MKVMLQVHEVKHNRFVSPYPLYREIKAQQSRVAKQFLEAVYIRLKLLLQIVTFILDSKFGSH